MIIFMFVSTSLTCEALEGWRLCRPCACLCWAATASSASRIWSQSVILMCLIYTAIVFKRYRDSRRYRSTMTTIAPCPAVNSPLPPLFIYVCTHTARTQQNWYRLTLLRSCAC